MTSWTACQLGFMDVDMHVAYTKDVVDQPKLSFEPVSQRCACSAASFDVLNGDKTRTTSCKDA